MENRYIGAIFLKALKLQVLKKIFKILKNCKYFIILNKLILVLKVVTIYTIFFTRNRDSII